MAKIIRATQQIFGDNALGTQITAFGTAKTNNPVYTKDPAQLQTASSLLGWADAIEADRAPFEEDTNGLCYLVTRQLAYLYQQGIPEWDSNTTYYKNSIVQVVQDNLLVLKRSLTDNNTGHNPTSDNVNWADYYSTKVIHTIGDPIITLNSTLANNEIWLEGSTVSRTTYANLFSIYGTTYGAGNGSTTFKLPDFRNRAIWGSNGYGYLSAGLPNITGSFRANDLVDNVTTPVVSGALYYSTNTMRDSVNGTSGKSYTINFQASRSNSIYGASSTVQPPAIKVRVKTRYQ